MLPLRARWLLPLLLLAACASQPSAENDPRLAPPPRMGQPSGLPPPAPGAPVGLVPLPTPQQVVASLPVGRRDPFGSIAPPLPAEGAAAAKAPGRPGKPPAGRPPAPAALRAPADFLLTGVIRSGGLNEAVVQFGTLSGTLRPGDRGGYNTDLLPLGWSVAAIDVQRGRLTLQNDRQSVIVEL